MIGVLGLVARILEILAAVVCYVHLHIHLVNAIEGVRAGKQFLVIMRARAAGNIVVTLFPGLAAVFRTVEAAGAI